MTKEKSDKLPRSPDDEFARASQSRRLNVIHHRMIMLRQDLQSGLEWTERMASEDPSGTAKAGQRFSELFDIAVSILSARHVVDVDGVDTRLLMLTPESAQALIDALREMAVSASICAEAIRSVVYAERGRPGQPDDPETSENEKRASAITSSVSGLSADTYWLASVRARAMLAGLSAEEQNAERIKRMRSRRAMGFRSASVNVHETDFLTLRRLGLLPGENPSKADIENALDAFLSVALATAEAEIDMATRPSRADPQGSWRLRRVIDRLAALVRAHAD